MATFLVAISLARMFSKDVDLLKVMDYIIKKRTDKIAKSRGKCFYHSDIQHLTKTTEPRYYGEKKYKHIVKHMLNIESLFATRLC